MKEAKVIRILSNTQLIIDKGINQGIKENNRFNILGKRTNENEIKDAEGKSYGYLDPMKGTVIVKNVYPEFSVVEGAPKTQSVASMLSMPSIPTTLNVDQNEIEGFKNSSENGPIKVGDQAIQID